MASIRSDKRKKPKAAARTNPRVKSKKGTGRRGGVVKSAEHKAIEPRVQAIMMDLGNGETLAAVQMSELVPTGEYANVTIGPIQLATKVTGLDITKLVGVNWDDADEPLTDEQQKVYDQARGLLDAMARPIEHHIHDDRDLVEKSVAAASAREDAEAAKKSSGRRSRK